MRRALRWWQAVGESVTFFEIKRQKNEIALGVLKQKAETFLQATHQFKGYEIAYKGLSMEEMWNIEGRFVIEDRIVDA